MHSLSNPARYGLTLMRERRGQVSMSPTQHTVISGELVSDVNGKLWVFVGLTAEREPILSDDLVDYRNKMFTLTVDRMHA